MGERGTLRSQQKGKVWARGPVGERGTLRSQKGKVWAE